MKFLADCKITPVEISAIPNTPIHTAVNPGPTIASTESVNVDIALSPNAAPVARSPMPGNPKTRRGFFCESDNAAQAKTVRP